MSIPAYQLLETLQEDVLAILRNTPVLQDANIIPEQNGDLETEVERLLGLTKQGTGGKRGLVLIVLMPEVTTAESNLPGPPLLVKQEIQIIEHPRINRSTAGTGLRSSHAALLALHTLHLHTLGGHSLYAADKPVQPLPAKDGLISHVVSIFLRANGMQATGKTAAIHPSIAADLITLTTATAGAAIYYTADGTYPTPSNGTLYTTPFTAPDPGTLIRAAAYAPDLNPSDLLEFTITAGPSIPALAYLSPDGEPYLSPSGEYYLAPA